MLIYLLDEYFEIVLPTDMITSLQWNTKYYDTGDFQLHLSVSPELISDGTLEKYRNSAYVYVTDNGCTGIIQQHEYRDGKYIMKGRTLEALLNSKVLDTQFVMTGKAEEVARALIDRFIINPSSQSRKIPNLSLGVYKGLGKVISYSQRGKHVDESAGEILYTQELSYRLHYDFVEKQIYFEVFQGVDRTQNSAVNTWAVFSKDLGNIKDGSEIYTYSTKYKNFAHVLGGNDSVVTVDQTNGNAAKELWVNAKDLTDASEMWTRGKQMLSEYQQMESVQFQIQADDIVFSIGDICEYVNKDLNITTTGRITEINEVWESSVYEKRIILGEDQLTLPLVVKRALS